MKQPLVSVVVPTKNSSATLSDCLQSIQTQDYQNIEILVVDNFSSDETPSIAKQFTKRFYSKGPERSFQRNFAVENATGKYVCIIDSDMNLSNSVISECVSAIQKTSDIRGVIIPEESFGIGFWAQCKKLERSFYLNIPYMEAARFFYRADFQKLGGYNTEMVSGEDWDLSQRVEEIGRLDRINSMILHNEGKISLLKTIQKKYYYAFHFATYTQSSQNDKKVSQQTSVFGRYRLFLSNPKKLFRRPLLGAGMLFMKTCEFAFGGLGYLHGRVSGKS